MLLLLLVAPGAGAPAAQAERRILLLGDSISAAYGMSLREGWAALLQRRLERRRPGWRVVNASISGETAAGGAARLPALLGAHRPAVVLIELGGNDGLRGYPIAQLRGHLRGMIRRAQSGGARVLILGMAIPPNYGARYTRMFRESYALLAAETGAALLPFLLEGVASERALMLEDGIHPTAAAQRRLLDNVWPRLEPLLAAAR